MSRAIGIAASTIRRGVKDLAGETVTQMRLLQRLVNELGIDIAIHGQPLGIGAGVEWCIGRSRSSPR